MDEELAKFYVAQIVLALEYLHANNIIYRDLKLQNVLLDRQGFIRLSDFGWSRRLDRGSRAYTMCGSPGWMAPECV